MTEEEKKCEIEDKSPYHCKIHHAHAPTACCEVLAAQKAELKAKFKKVMDDTPFIGADAFCYKINVQKQIEAL